MKPEAEAKTDALPPPVGAGAGRPAPDARRHLPLLLGAAVVALIVAFVAWPRPKEPPTPMTPAEATLPPSTVPSSLAEEPPPTAPTARPSASPAKAAKKAPAPITPSPIPSPQATATPPLVAEGDFVPLGAGVTPPVRTSGAAAPYPPAARRGGMSGTVAVDILVDEKGTPTQVDVIESAGKILDDAVVKAVKTWHFEPATKDGIRVKTRLRSRQTYK